MGTWQRCPRGAGGPGGGRRHRRRTTGGGTTGGGTTDRSATSGSATGRGTTGRGTTGRGPAGRRTARRSRGAARRGAHPVVARPVRGRRAGRDGSGAGVRRWRRHRGAITTRRGRPARGRRCGAGRPGSGRAWRRSGSGRRTVGVQVVGPAIPGTLCDGPAGRCSASSGGALGAGGTPRGRHLDAEAAQRRGHRGLRRRRQHPRGGEAGGAQEHAHRHQPGDGGPAAPAACTGLAVDGAQVGRGDLRGHRRGAEGAQARDQDVAAIGFDRQGNDIGREVHGSYSAGGRPEGTDPT